MRVWAVAGGTGGHFYPALAVVEELENRVPGVEVKFAVSRRGLEARVLSSQNRPFKALVVEGFHRREVFRNLIFPFRTAAGFGQSVFELVRFRPHVAFGTGGFVSGPGLFAAWCMGVPVALIALDALPGVTIRMLAPIARKVYVTHEQAVRVLRGRVEAEVIGIPVRPSEPVGRITARARLRLPAEGFVLFVTGGSQGSAALNRAVGQALPDLLNMPDLTVLWQTGRDRLEEVEQLAEDVLKAGPAEYRGRVVLYPFLDEMAAAWQSADLALCRAGASTIAELSTFGVPALLVPLPSAAGGHQAANAGAMAEAGAALLLPEEELSGRRLVREVDSLLRESGRLKAMAEATEAVSRQDGAAVAAGGLVRIARWLSDRDREEMLGWFEGAGR